MDVKTKKDLAVDFINAIRTMDPAALNALIVKEAGEDLAQFFLNYSANLISKDPSRVLENTSSLMLMGYLIRTHEEKNAQPQQRRLPGLRARLTGCGAAREARQAPREPARERRPCSSTCTRTPTSPRVATWIRARCSSAPRCSAWTAWPSPRPTPRTAATSCSSSARKSKLKVFVGLELITDKGQYLCFFPKPELAPEPVQMWGSNREKPWSAAECLPKVKSLGAAIVAARPYDRDSPNPAMDYVRSLNGCSAPWRATTPGCSRPPTTWPSRPPRRSSSRASGGSDARGSLDEVGRGATFFKRAHRDAGSSWWRRCWPGEYWPVMAGELPRLTRPGEAQASRGVEASAAGVGRAAAAAGVAVSACPPASGVVRPTGGGAASSTRVTGHR